MDQNNDRDWVAAIRQARIETAFKVNIGTSLAYLAQFSSPQKGVVESPVPILDGVDITFQKVNRAFEFNTGPLKWIDSYDKYQSSAFGFGKPFTITWQGKTLFVDNRGGNNLNRAAEHFASSGELYDLRVEKSGFRVFFRAVFPLSKMMKKPTEYMRGVDFCHDKWYHEAGMYHLTLDDLPFHYFEVDCEGQRYLFFDAGAAMDLNTFQDYLDAVVAGYAFVCGSYVKDEIWYLESSNPTFDEIIGFSWERLDDSVDGWEEILAPKLYKELNPLDELPWLDDKVFERLVQISINDKRILRAIKLISEARGIKTELAAASYCVAMETVSSILVKESYDDLKPVKDDGQRELLITQLKKVVEEWDDEEFNDKAMILRKINNVVQVGNNEKFFRAFELKGIALSKDEEEFLKKRNSYLHGNVPFKGENRKDPYQFELKKISLHIHMLTCTLILKMAGYNGPILNFWKYWELHRGENKEPMPLFKNI